MSNNANRILDGQLTYEMFRVHPIWTHYDWDSSEVVPVEYPSWKTDAIGGEAIFLLGNVLLRDETNLPAIISFNGYSKHAFYISILSGPTSDIAYPIGGPTKGRVTKEALASALGKAVSEVFPMRYQTPFVYTNGELIAGVCE